MSQKDIFTAKIGGLDGYPAKSPPYARAPFSAPVRESGLSVPSRARLGEILVGLGQVLPSDIDGAIKAQSKTKAPLGQILIANGAADRMAVAAAAARQLGIPFTELLSLPVEETLLNDTGLEVCLRHRVVPLRREGGRVVFAASDPQKAVSGLREEGRAARVEMAEGRAVQEKLITLFARPLARRAATKRPAASSHRAGAAWWQRGLILLAFGITALLLLIAPMIGVTAALVFATAIMAMNGALWGGTLVSAVNWSKPVPIKNAAALSQVQVTPKVTIIVALYREPETAAALIEALSTLEYPAELLDIKLVLEEDDGETLAALRAERIPPHIDILIAPEGAPRTKPRALNFALDFAEGDIIGIYDAEDRPPTDQIRKIVAAFAAAPPDVACIQARLGYYNADENWLTRLFEMEYASWFDVMLPGLHRLGLPLPLGGTSLFVRRAALEQVGGWDSHNVTEDADLGMMLARAGLRTGLSDSLTLEEASSLPGAWVRQRSRWLKGYLVTWTTHMRKPATLWRDLGAMGFMGFNAVLLSAALGYLLLPMLWAATVASFLMPPTMGPVGLALDALRAVTAATLPLLFLAGIVGLSRRGRFRDWPVILTSPLYWCLGAAAAYLAVWELIFAPTRWRKTTHGVGRIAQDLREAVRARSAAAAAEKPEEPKQGTLPRMGQMAADAARSVTIPASKQRDIALAKLRNISKEL